ncbi:unnamed protein product [Zymoseptoria tritici ST99CH_3D7]|uniref:Dynein light intermediate chain n=3 Tax=Zymoseptoria tritici TaxID=1047171 RepID=A0A1X7RPL5_ZYMT9|nr:unnamed protein product [Zymoseptoria tritici ST99CH_3D7]
MATTMSRPTTTPFPGGRGDDRPLKRKKEQRTDIWSNLLRQTREAQARSRTQAVQHRELLVCGGSPDDQRSFLQSLARPPPAQPQSRNQERRTQRTKGELRLSNKYAYGYGHVTLFSPPPQGGAGVQVLGAEAEEVARLELHTLPDAEEGYVGTLRGLLVKKIPEEKKEEGQTEGDSNGLNEELAEDTTDLRRPVVCVLLSWKKPWEFLDQLRRWIQLLAQALLQPGVPATDPMDILQEAQLALTVVVQHTEAQEALFREGYKEEDFDYISQCLRTAILPLHPLSSLVYMSSTAPPQQPGSPLSEVQKVLYTCLGLDLSVLTPKLPRTGDSAKKDETGPKHEFMDRMAIVIPPGWDSAAFIRTLSETFAPEETLTAWLADLQPAVVSPLKAPEEALKQTEEDTTNGAEIFESSPPAEEPSPQLTSGPSSARTNSAVEIYQSRIIDPQSHRTSRNPTGPPKIEVTTKPHQEFLAEMRAHLQELEQNDRERDRPSGVSTTSLSGSGGSGRPLGVPQGEQTGALGELGDVSFNVGGVSYDTISAEAAIDRLRRPVVDRSDTGGGGMGSPAAIRTPKVSRPGRDSDRERDREVRAQVASPESRELPPIDKLEEYFSSLMKTGGGGSNSGSRNGTPSRVRE